MTKQRKLIYQIIQNSTAHLNAEEVYDLAKEQMPSIVRATIYNNLNALTDQGLIRRVRVSGEPDRYDRRLSPHDHLVCRECGKLSDITLGDMKKELEERSGVEISGYELSLYYVCPDCRRKHKK